MDRTNTGWQTNSGWPTHSGWQPQEAQSSTTDHNRR